MKEIESNYSNNVIFEEGEFTGNLEDYYMVDFNYFEETHLNNDKEVVKYLPRWVREPMVHKDNLPKLLYQISFSLEKGLIENLRIQSEVFLQKKRSSEWLEEEQEYKEDSITNRQYFFDQRYQDNVDFLLANKS